MSKTIWKFPLDLTDFQTVDMPRGATALSAGLDPVGQLCVWALVEPDLGMLPVMVRIIGTGNPADGLERWHFVGSVKQGSFVWHVFVEGV
jgi:hypothetical protein